MSLKRLVCVLVFVDVFVALALVTGGCQRSSEPAQTEEAAQTEQAIEKTEESKSVALPTATARAGVEADGEASCGKGEDCSGGCNQWDEAADKVAAREVPEKAVWHKFKVEGMTCGGCERRVIANVGAIDGILNVEADAELGVVRIATASTADKQADEKLLALSQDRVRELGYTVVQ